MSLSSGMSGLAGVPGSSTLRISSSLRWVAAPAGTLSRPRLWRFYPPMADLPSLSRV